YFCSVGCRAKFAADPAKYLGPARADEPVPEGTVYTCPMHPEVRQIGPGACPICGMALEPEVVTADTGPNPELADMRRRLWIGAALTAPVFLLEMAATCSASKRSAALLRTGSRSCSRRQWCCGRARPSLCAATARSSPATSICLR